MNNHTVEALVQAAARAYLNQPREVDTTITAVTRQLAESGAPRSEQEVLIVFGDASFALELRDHPLSGQGYNHVRLFEALVRPGEERIRIKDLSFRIPVLSPEPTPGIPVVYLGHRGTGAVEVVGALSGEMLSQKGLIAAVVDAIVAAENATLAVEEAPEYARGQRPEIVIIDESGEITAPDTELTEDQQVAAAVASIEIVEEIGDADANAAAVELPAADAAEEVIADDTTEGGEAPADVEAATDDVPAAEGGFVAGELVGVAGIPGEGPQAIVLATATDMPDDQSELTGQLLQGGQLSFAGTGDVQSSHSFDHAALGGDQSNEADAAAAVSEFTGFTNPIDDDMNADQPAHR